MPVSITLGYAFGSGEQVTPEKFHRLVEEANVTGFEVSDLGAGVALPTYGPTRPALARGLMHYDTTAGLEGLYFSFASASNASVLGWLAATPRRECYCWANSAVSAGTPVFIGKPHGVSDPGSGSGFEYRVFDGCIFPQVWSYSATSGPDAAMFITMESATNNMPVKCMWAGMVPDSLGTLNLISAAASSASIGSPLFVNYAGGHAWRFGQPSARNLVFGVNTQNNSTGLGSIIWGTGCAIEDLTA
jgi:hypothetical protein